MKRNGLRALVLAMLALTLVACSQTAAPTALASEQAAELRGGGGLVQPAGQVAEGLVVIGTGMVSAEPEIANVGFGVELRGDDPAAIVDEAARKIDEATAAAVEMGISVADIRTVGYNLWVETIHDPETGVPTGEVVYHISHHVRAKLLEIDRVGELLAAVVSSGANTVSEVSFSVEDPDSLIDQARLEALNDAAARAEQMAGGLSITLGPPMLVMETGGGYPVPQGIGGGAEMARAAAPSISPGTFSVSVSIQVVYEIR